MTTLALPSMITSRSGAMDIGPLTRTMVLIIGGGMSAICLLAIARGLFGFTPELPHLKNVALVFHIVTVLPCIPLGGYLLLAKKGTPNHKRLGKLWVSLMLVTATSTLFLYDDMRLTWIHIFVPITFRASWLIVTSARKGNMKQHRKEILGLYFGALMIPGLAAFVIPGRLMNVLLLG